MELLGLKNLIRDKEMLFRFLTTYTVTNSDL
jgi:hypothetical protein